MRVLQKYEPQVYHIGYCTISIQWPLCPALGNQESAASSVLFYHTSCRFLLAIISKIAHPQLCMQQRYGDTVQLTVAGITLHPANPTELFLVILSRQRDQLPKSMFIACCVIQTGCPKDKYNIFWFYFSPIPSYNQELSGLTHFLEKVPLLLQECSIVT